MGKILINRSSVKLRGRLVLLRPIDLAAVVETFGAARRCR
jgi:hypothetical protein